MRIPFLVARVVAAAKHVPMADLAVTASGAALLLGGASVLLGVKPKWGTALIAGFLAGVSPIMHDFSRIEDPNQRMNDMINFSKNAALLGGALALMSIEEPWPASLPGEKNQRRHKAAPHRPPGDRRLIAAASGFRARPGLRLFRRGAPPPPRLPRPGSRGWRYALMRLAHVVHETVQHPVQFPGLFGDKHQRAFRALPGPG